MKNEYKIKKNVGANETVKSGILYRKTNANRLWLGESCWEESSQGEFGPKTLKHPRGEPENPWIQTNKVTTRHGKAPIIK